MTKHAIVVMGASDTPEGRGRMNHALRAAKSLADREAEVGLFFHGIGVTWMDAFDRRDDRFTQNYGELFDEVKDKIGGACDFCAATRFQVDGAAANLGVSLLGGSGEHHDIGELVADGWTVVTF
jgi:hypothetical protein